MGKGNAFKPLASYKVASRKVRTEGSRTANFGTDEQEAHKRHETKDKYPHQCDVQSQQSNADAQE